MKADATSETTPYPNVWRLIDGATAREIAGFGDDHYRVWASAPSEEKTSVRLLQIEFDMFDDHPSVHGRVERLFGEESSDYFYRYSSLDHAIHGTASASIISDVNFGVAPGAKLYFTGVSKSSLLEQDGADPYQILPVIRRVRENNANNLLRPGDVISISLQFSQRDSRGRSYNFPLDANYSVQEEINALSDMGFIVFIAAGNSRLDLDHATIVDADGFHQSYKRLTRDSSAIKVGYTGMTSGSRHWSNYGSMVTFCAPAGSVSAACYEYRRDLRRSDLIDTFVGGFGKTSAATPIVAAISAKVQRLYKQQNEGEHLNRRDMIALLKKCGARPVQCVDDTENDKDVGVIPSGHSIESHFRE